MQLFYAAVHGDPLTSHKDSHVVAHEGHPSTRVCGEDGKARNLAYIGDSAWCGACRNMGVIVGGAGIGEDRRMIDLAGGGRRQAVGGDEVRCNCSIPPRIVPVYGKRWTITDEAKRDTGSVQKQAMPRGPVAEPTHVRWFSIVDSTTGEPLPGREFIANVDGAKLAGRTDSNGYARIATDGGKSVDMHVVFRSPRRKLNASGI